MKKISTYVHDVNVHNKESALEVVPFLIDLLNPQSVVDLGCGLGDWLSVFQKNGVEKILGIDGNWVDKTNLYIKEDFFLENDLTKPFRLKQKFDLAISLEVAEHLPESSSDTFVETLINLSDNIIFSAAIPNQGGQNHINEQWHSYWVEKFEGRGFYCYDIIRPLIWNNKNVQWWYKQNMFFFSRQKLNVQNNILINSIHPDLFQSKNAYNLLISNLQKQPFLLLKLFVKSIVLKFTKLWGN
jgi:SAM-dependent methyltransferase